MRCEEFESRLNDQLDERQAPLANAALAEHAAVCSSCAVIARGYETLCDGVSAWERVEPSADLTDRVVAQWQLLQAQSAQSLASSTDWDSAELPALRPVGLPGAGSVAARSGGFWSLRRDLVLAGAALATAAAVLVIGGVSPKNDREEAPAIAAAPATVAGPTVVAQDTPRVPVSSGVSSQPAAPQFALTSLPIVEQMTNSYRPLLAETDRAVRKSLGLPEATSGQMISSAATMGLITHPGPADREPSWDSLLPDQVAPVTQSAVRSVVALLRVLPGVEQPVHQ